MSSALAEQRKPYESHELKRGVVSGYGDLTPFFFAAYLAHGFACAQFGVMAQPIQFFMKSGLGLDAAQISSLLALMMLPWVMKPFYAAACDFIPFMGYRRKSYLVAANLTTAFSLIGISLSQSLYVVLALLMLTAFAMSISTALLAGLMVESGRNEGKVRHYFSVQEIAYYSASIFAALAGGYLCSHLLPVSALHAGAAIASIPALLMAGASCWMLREKRVSFDVSGMKKTGTAFLKAARSRNLWLTAIITTLFCFSPAFGVPLYFFQSNSLGFSQASIGQLAAWNACGMVVGALIFRLLLKHVTRRGQLFLTVTLLISSTLSYFLLSDLRTAHFIEVFRGTANVFTLLAVYGLAADACPRRAEVSVMAILVAVRNIATDVSTFAGGQLFTHVFDSNFHPLILVSTIGPLAAAAMILLCPSLTGETVTVERAP